MSTQLKVPYFYLLPAELLDDICWHIPPKCLKLLSCTCTLLLPHAQAVLFKRVALHDHAARERYLLQSPCSRHLLRINDPQYDLNQPSAKINDHTTFRKFYETILRSPHLCKYVRSLSISMRWEISWEHLGNLLPKLVNLDYLALQAPFEPGSNQDVPSLNLPRVKLRIREFRSHRIAMDQSLIEFLVLQPNLVRWDISGVSIESDLEIPSFLLARIACYSQRSQTGKRLVLQGMTTKLTHLHIDCHWIRLASIREQYLEALASYGANLISFSSHGASLLWILEHVLPLTPELRFLHVAFRPHIGDTSPFSLGLQKLTGNNLPTMLETLVYGFNANVHNASSSDGFEVDGRQYLCGEEGWHRIARARDISLERSPRGASMKSPEFIETFEVVLPSLKRIVLWKDAFMHDFRRSEKGGRQWEELPVPATDIDYESWRYV